MKVQTTKFRAAIATVMPAVAKRSTLPILQHVCLLARGDRMTLSATDLNIAITCEIPVSAVPERVGVTLPARLLYDYVSVLEGAEVELDINVKTNTVGIKGILNSANLKGLDAGDFPTLEEPSGPVFDLSQGALEFLVGRALVSAADDQSRPVLTGIFTELTGRTVKMVSADGYRLSNVKSTQEWEASKDVVALIPAKAIAALMKLCAAYPEEAVRMSLTDKKAFFVIGDATLVAMLINESFPDYKQIIPTRWETRATIEDPTELLRAVKMLRLLNFALAWEVRDDGKIVICTDELDVGEGRVEIDAQVEGPTLEIGLSADYLKDVLSVMWKNQPIEIWFTTPVAPALFKQGEDFEYCLMPLRLGS